MHSADNSRSLTSSPFDNSSSSLRYINPLTVSVSANESDYLQCTPIKNQDLENNCSNSSSSSSCNSSINIETNEPIVKPGLLTYSTPIVSTLFAQTKQAYSKPRVNFHSIEDIVYGGQTSPNDSGFVSSNNNTVKSPEFSSASSSENKENNNNSTPLNSMDNGKKVRTTFTDHQKSMLDVYFRKNPYPDPSETEELSQQLVLPENVIKVWFQNKRSRDKQRTFSHSQKSKNMYKNQVVKKEVLTNGKPVNMFDSPLVANLKNISKFNSYTQAAAALAVFAQAAQNGNNFYNSQSSFYSN